MTNKTNHLALVALDAFGSKYPGIWKHIDAIRALGLADDDPWPSWCFLPIVVSHDLLRVMREEPILSSDGCSDSTWLSSLAAWRVTKGIYKFDPDVYEAVVNSPVAGMLPFEVLCRLPEWCVYVETPGLSLFGKPVDGMWAHLEWNEHLQRASLNILAHSSTFSTYIVVGLNTWTLREALSSSTWFDGDGERLQFNVDQLCEDIEPFVSLLLYLCSPNSEVGDGTTFPRNPRPKMVRNDLRLFQAERLTQWDVGIRMGAKLRKSGVTTTTSSGSSHGSPRPHIRRAHWQGFRLGPRTDSQGCAIPVSDRDIYMKWLPPMLINEPVGGVQLLPATVRTVI